MIEESFGNEDLEEVSSETYLLLVEEVHVDDLELRVSVDLWESLFI
jgi:hypothetical protein